jgi:hypothetical protein
MRIRYFSYLSLATAAAFLVVATQAFTLPTIAALSLGVGIGLLVVALGVAQGFRRDVPSLTIASLIALVSAWNVIASQVFSYDVVKWATFGDAAAVVVLALAGLTAHELSSERVVHSLEVGERRAPQATDRPIAA